MAEQPQAQASNMTAPPAASNMVAAPAKKKVKIRALQPIAVDGVTLAVGVVTEVDEEVAVEFCDKKFKGQYSFSGERGINSAERHMLVRAERVHS